MAQLKVWSKTENGKPMVQIAKGQSFKITGGPTGKSVCVYDSKGNRIENIYGMEIFYDKKLKIMKAKIEVLVELDLETE